MRNRKSPLGRVWALALAAVAVFCALVAGAPTEALAEEAQEDGTERILHFGIPMAEDGSIIPGYEKNLAEAETPDERLFDPKMTLKERIAYEDGSSTYAPYLDVTYSANVPGASTIHRMRAAVSDVGYTLKDPAAFCVQMQMTSPSQGMRYTSYTPSKNAALNYFISERGWRPGRATPSALSSAGVTNDQYNMLSAYVIWILVGSTSGNDPNEAWNWVNSKWGPDARRWVNAMVNEARGKASQDPDTWPAMIWRRSDRQDIIVSLNPKIEFQIQKESAVPGVSDGNPNYSLKGALYGVYSDAACTSLVARMTTNASGFASAQLNVKTGTSYYYVKELAPPPGFAVDSTVHRVQPGIAGAATKKLTHREQPQYADANLELLKRDDLGNPVSGAGTLEGAEYRIDFYAGKYESVSALPNAATRSWTVRTGADGKASLQRAMDDPEKYLVNGGAFYTVNGKAVLPLGTLAITETKAPKGYVLDPDTRVVPVASSGAIQRAQVMTPVMRERGIRGELAFDKIDALTGRPMAGVPFKMTSKTTGESHVVVTNAEGKVDTSTAPKGRTNNNDRALDDAKAKLDPEQGVWFSGKGEGRPDVPLLSADTIDFGETVTWGPAEELPEGTTYNYLWRNSDDWNQGAAWGSSMRSQGVRQTGSSYSFKPVTPGVWQVYFSAQLPDGTSFSTQWTDVLVRDTRPAVSASTPASQLSVSIAQDRLALVSGNNDSGYFTWGPNFKLPEGAYVDYIWRKGTDWSSSNGKVSGTGNGTATVRAPSAGTYQVWVEVYFPNGTKLTGPATTFEVKASGVQQPGLDQLPTRVASDTAVEGRAALPFDTYEVEEIRGVANEGYRLAEPFEVVVTEDGALVEVEKAVENEPEVEPTLSTRATDKADGDKTVDLDGIVLEDAVTYENVLPGREYRLETTVYNKHTREILKKADGTNAVWTTEFTPAANKGEVKVELDFSIVAAGEVDWNHELVVYQRLVRVSTGDVVATHADPNDAEQTVVVSGLAELVFQKLDGSDETKPLEGARFKLESTDLAELPDADDGRCVTGTVGEYETDANGSFSMPLMPGVYRLVETRAPHGYVKPSGGAWYVKLAYEDGKSKVTVRATGDIPYIDCVQDESKDSWGVVKVRNQPATVLPVTGAGSIAVTTAGVVSLAGIGWTTRRFLNLG